MTTSRRPSTKRYELLTRLLTVLIVLAALTADSEEPQFAVDFSRSAGPPLSKSFFGVYQTPLVTSKRLLASLPLLREANVHDFRYELGWGKPDALAASQISGNAEDPCVDFTALDPFLKGLCEQQVRTLFVLGYCPDPLNSNSGWPAWKDLPRDLKRWQLLCRDYATHWRAPAGFPSPIYEVWNEPDLPEGNSKTFFTGNPTDYGQLYAATVAGVHAGDPDAIVGGPAVAYNLNYLVPLLGQRLDFASIHAYANFPDQLSGLSHALVDRPTIPLYLTEYASFAPADMPPNGPQSRFPAAALFFRDALALLEQPGLAKVYWAQWLDAGNAPGLGFITWDGHRKAIFNALKIYGQLPEHRALVAPAAFGNIHLVASSDDHRAGIVLWNEGDLARTTQVDFTGLPFSAGNLEDYCIDAHHGSYVDDPASEELSRCGPVAFTRDFQGT